MSRQFPSCLDHVLFESMENPLIAGRIQLERFISVEVFEKIGNTFDVLLVFLILLKSQKLFVPFGDNLYQYYSISEKTAIPKMAKLQNSPYFCVFKYARAVKQKVWNEAENRAYDSSPISLLILRKKTRLFCSLKMADSSNEKTAKQS